MAADKFDVVLPKLVTAFKALGHEAVVEGVEILTDVGRFGLSEPYGKRRGTWLLKSTTYHSLNSVTIYCPSTHKGCDEDAVKCLGYLIRGEKSQLAMDKEQTKRQTISADAKEILSAHPVEFEPEEKHFDFIRTKGLGDKCAFTLRVPIERAPEVAAKFAQLAAELGLTSPTSPS